MPAGGHPARWSGRYMGLVLAVTCLALPVAAAQSRGAAYVQSVLTIQKQIEAGDLDAARAAIASVAKKYPSDGGLENLLGVIEAQQGHVAAARRAFLAAVRHDPKLAGAYLNLSRIDMQMAAQDATARAEALQMSEKALQMDAGSDEARYQVATIFAWEKNYVRSLAELARLSQPAREKIGAQSLACEANAVLGNSAAASQAVHALAGNADFDELDVAGCVSALRAAHRPELIVELLSASAARHPLSPSGLRMLGLAQEADGKLEPARATLETAFAADNSSVTILIDLTRVARSAGDNLGALGYLAHARDLRPKDATLAYEFGVICVQMGLYAEARKAIGEALAIDPENPEYNLGMGLVVSFSEDPSQALPYLKKYHALRPEDPEGVLALGSTCFRAKDYDTAEQWLKLASRQAPTAAEAHYYLGRVARQEGRTSEAIGELKESLRLQPDQASVLAELGQIAVAQKNNAEAAGYLDRAVQLDPDNYAGNYGLLELYARTNDPRREQQTKRFDEVKEKRNARDLEMMRTFEIRREGESDHPDQQKTNQ